MMRSIHALPGALVALALSTPILAAPTDMREGLWEISTRMEMPAMPGLPKGMALPATTLRHCYTAQDIQQGRNLAPENDPGCKLLHSKQSGARFSWAMECRGASPSRIEGEGTWTRDRFDMKQTIRFTSGEMKGQTMTSQVSGRHLGKCEPARR